MCRKGIDGWRHEMGEGMMDGVMAARRTREGGRGMRHR